MALPGGTPPSGNSGSSWTQWLGPVLGFAGSAAQGYANYAGSKAGVDEQKREFNNTQLLAIQNLLNRAPLADKGQYLAMHMAPPTPFQPRDYTQGLGQVRGQATGGAAAQMAANNAAAMNYRPGAGGVDTMALRTLMARAGGPPQSYDTTTYSYAGKQYTPEEWAQFLNDHPDIAKTGV